MTINLELDRKELLSLISLLALGSHYINMGNLTHSQVLESIARVDPISMENINLKLADAAAELLYNPAQNLI